MPNIDLRDCTRRESHSTSGPVRRAQVIDIPSVSLHEEVTGESIVDNISEGWETITRARAAITQQETANGHSDTYEYPITESNAGAGDIYVDQEILVDIPFYATREGDIELGVDTSASSILSQGSVGPPLTKDLVALGNNRYRVTSTISYNNLEAGDIIRVVTTYSAAYSYRMSDFLGDTNRYAGKQVDLDYSSISGDGVFKTSHRYALEYDTITSRQNNTESDLSSQYETSCRLVTEKDENTGLYDIGFSLTVRVKGPDADARTIDYTVGDNSVIQYTVLSSYQDTGDTSVNASYNSPEDVYVTNIRSPIVKVDLDKSAFPTVGYTAYSKFTEGPQGGGGFSLSRYVWESSFYYTYHWNVIVNGVDLLDLPGIVNDQTIYINNQQLNAQTYYQGR